MTQALESVNGPPRQRNTLTKLGTKRVTGLLYWVPSPRSITKSKPGSQSLDALFHNQLISFGIEPSPSVLYRIEM